MSRSCIEVTVRVPLPAEVTLAHAIAVAQTESIEVTRLRDGRELVGVAILADGRRLEIGEDKIREWVAAGCEHDWVDPSNAAVDANGHELCRKCGALRVSEGPA